MSALALEVRKVLAERSSTGLDVLEAALATAGDIERASAFSACHRWFGSGLLPAAQASSLQAIDAELAWELWPLDALARLFVLARVQGTDPGFLGRISRHFDLREHEAVTRALGLLPKTEIVDALARESMRSNALTVFSALAVGNPYPYRYFDESTFNQMVVKCLFTGTRVSGIIGLERRLSPSLLRMLGDYRNELIATGKAVPSDLTGLLGAGVARGG